MGISGSPWEASPLFEEHSQEFMPFFQPSHLGFQVSFVQEDSLCPGDALGMERGILEGEQSWGCPQGSWGLGSDWSLSKPRFCLCLFPVLPWGKKSPQSPKNLNQKGKVQPASPLLTLLRTSSSCWACVHRLCSSPDLRGKMGDFAGVQHNSLFL